MLKKVSFFIVIILCLLFTVTIVNRLSLENTQVRPSAYFDDKDSTVFIINHPSDIDFKKDQIKTLKCNKNLFQSIKKDIPENCSVYLSQKRGLVIFEASSNWNKASVKELFINGQHKIHFTKLRHFNFGPFNGFYSKNKLIIHTKEITPAKCSNGFIIDKEANYCTVSYEKKKPIVKDFYKSKGNTLSYSKVPGKAEKFKNIDDQEIFSHFISDNFNSYSFYEKEYFAALDPSFQQSPIYSLTASGLLILKNKGNTLAIIELKNGQKCTETLNETEANENSSGNYIYYKDLEISGVLDQKNKGGYYITDIDGFAIISKNKVFFDHVNTEIKLGNVLLKNKAKMDNLFMGLPQKVLFRNVNKQVEIAVAKVGKTEEQLKEATATADIYDTIKSFNKEFETILGERGVNLSGGQKQRLSIARALLRKPELLILDDCLSAVDTETENRILERLKNQSKDQTTLIVSHRISTIRNAEKIIVINQGKIIEAGTHDSLLKNNGFYYNMYQQQLSEDDSEEKP